MKGLLKKDAYTLLRKARFFLLFILIFACLPGTSVASFAIVYASMLPITALAYDEHARWDTLAAMMPYSPTGIVTAKYVLGYLSIGCVLLVAGVVRLLAPLVTHKPQEAFFLTLGVTTCLALVLLAVLMPLMFRLGVERARLLFLVLLVAGVVIAAVLGQQVLTWLSGPQLHWGVFLAVFFAVAVVLNAVSIPLSVHFYRRKRR